MSSRASRGSSGVSRSQDGREPGQTQEAKNGPVARSTPARNAAEQLETRPPRLSKAEKPHRGAHEPQSKGANEASVGWRKRFFSGDTRRLEKQVKQLKVENKKLNDDVRDLESVLDDWEKYDISKNEEIADLRRDILAKGPASYHLDDEDVKSHFKSLRATICNIAYFRYRYGATGGAVPTVTRRQFEFIARDPELYMETRRKEQVIRAFIWTYLISHVFSLSGLLWAGDGHEDVESLSNLVADRSLPEDFYRWRAQTACLLFPSCGLNEKRMQDISLGLEDALRPYQSEEYVEGECDSMLRLVEQASRLDADISRSRACFRIYMRSPEEMKDNRPLDQRLYGFKFDGSLMESEPGGAVDGENVELVLSPTVLKHGDSNGENYDKGLVLMRAKVVCAARPASSPQETPSRRRASQRSPRKE